MTKVHYNFFKRTKQELTDNLPIYVNRETITLFDNPTSYDWRGWEDACVRRGIIVTPVIKDNKMKINIIIEL